MADLGAVHDAIALLEASAHIERGSARTWAFLHGQVDLNAVDVEYLALLDRTAAELRELVLARDVVAGEGMERYVITSSKRAAAGGPYVWTRTTWDGAAGLARTIRERIPGALVSVLDVGCGTLERWDARP